MEERFNPVADCSRRMIAEIEEWRRKIAEIEQSQVFREPYKHFAIDQLKSMIAIRENEIAGFERLIESIKHSWPLNGKIAPASPHV